MDKLKKENRILKILKEYIKNFDEISDLSHSELNKGNYINYLKLITKLYFLPLTYFFK